MIDQNLSPQALYNIARDSEHLTDDILYDLCYHSHVYPQLAHWAQQAVGKDVSLLAPPPPPAPPLPGSTKAPRGRFPWKLVSIGLSAALVGALVITSAIYVVENRATIFSLSTASAPKPQGHIAHKQAKATIVHRHSSASLEPVLVAQSPAFACKTSTVPGQIYCYGQNSLGQLGTGKGDISIHENRLTLGHSPIRFLSTGDGNFTCASTGTSVTCWGDNRWQQSSPSSATIVAPTTLLKGKPISALTVGTAHACALSGHDIYCWGSNGAGQMGSGHKDNKTYAPHIVASLPEATGLISSSFSTCALKGNSTLTCWGSNLNHRIDSSSSDIVAIKKGK